jgi:hypothetical protein
MSALLPGDAELIINGERRVLRLTLGALCAMEQTLGGGDFATLLERLKTPRAADLLLILHALIAGGGAPMTLELLKSADIDFAAAASAIGKAFRALGEGADAGKKPEGKGDPFPGATGFAAEFSR